MSELGTESSATNDGWKSRPVATHPENPTAVLLTDRVAEHIRDAHDVQKRRAGQDRGFDPVFRVAGDDVDLVGGYARQERQSGSPLLLCMAPQAQLDPQVLEAAGRLRPGGIVTGR